jgi:hypothetical protein
MNKHNIKCIKHILRYKLKDEVDCNVLSELSGDMSDIQEHTQPLFNYVSHRLINVYLLTGFILNNVESMT